MTFEEQEFEQPADEVSFQELSSLHVQQTILDVPAQLCRALGGIEQGRVILIFGGMGQGKSTSVAQVASAIANQLNGLVWWCDRDQAGDPSLIKRCFERTGSPTNRVKCASIGKNLPQTWRTLFKALPRSRADVIVFDTLQGWTTPVELEDFSAECQSHPATIFVISRVNKVGEVEGMNSVQHDVDAIAQVTREEIRVTQKCRWTPVPRIFSRLTGEVREDAE